MISLPNADPFRSYITNAIQSATAACIRILNAERMAFLEEHCPGLKTFDYVEYLERSELRVARVLDALDRYTVSQLAPAAILDFGSWLGNFSLAARYAGWNVHSCEMWARYAPALDLQKKMLADFGVDVIDTSMIVGRPQGPRYDAVLLMAVIEHLQTPRHILKTLYHSLMPGGYLILDCPNIAYLPNRRKLNRGRSPYAAVRDQFYSEQPFEGHVREYTAEEIEWMLNESGFEVLETDFSNYSPLSWWKIPVLDQIRMLFPPYQESPILDALQMALNPEKRELIFMIARKK